MTTTLNRYLVTGAMGCLGAWTLYHLVQRGSPVVSFDLSDNRSRLDLLMDADEQTRITFVTGDLTDSAQVLSAIQQHGITHIIHLAALQVPFCRANPILGAQVNVVGTVNVFEAARAVGIRHVAYASSVAVFGNASEYPPGALANDAPTLPRTLYGVYKVANEQMAKVYWQDQQISSTALRPYTIYGVGRDQGLTSEPTKAMLSAARGENFHISFGGMMQFQWASDTALQFIDASEPTGDGAHVFNLGGAPYSIEVVAQMIQAVAPTVKITVGDARLPFADALDDTALRNHVRTVYETPLAEGIRQTIKHFTKVSA